MKIKKYLHSFFDSINEPVADSREFRKNERSSAASRPKATSVTTPVVATCPSNTYAEQMLAQKQCAALAAHIVRGMADFPSHINIEPYNNAISVPLWKIDNSTFVVKFYKKDCSREFTLSDFRVELQRELNDRMTKVSYAALQEIQRAKEYFCQTCQLIEYNYLNMVAQSCYDTSHLQCEYAKAQLDCNNAISSNYVYLNNLHFSNLTDKGTYVLVIFTASYNGGAAIG